MSSRVSMPTDRRTRPGVTPVELLLGDVELAVRRARGVDREAAHVADVGEVAEQLETVDEVAARVDAALQLERDDRALAVGQVLLARGRTTCSTSGPGTRPSRPRRAPSSHFATASAFCECRSMRRLNVCRPWRNRNELNGEIAGADVALVLQAAFRMYSRAAAPAGSCDEHEAVVARVGLGEAGEAAAARRSRTSRRRRSRRRSTCRARR